MALINALVFEECLASFSRKSLHLQITADVSKSSKSVQRDIIFNVLPEIAIVFFCIYIVFTQISQSREISFAVAFLSANNTKTGEAWCHDI